MKKSAALKSNNIMSNASKARAWFDTVINPLLEALEMEMQLLSENNWTWRLRPPRLEFIRKTGSCLDREGKINIKQMIKENKKTKVLVEHHDAQIDQLQQSCLQLHKLLVENVNLRNIYNQLTKGRVLAELNTNKSALFGPSSSDEDNIALIAEYIVNNKKTIPNYHTLHPLWDKYADEFLNLREKNTIKNIHLDNIKAGAILHSLAQNLCSHLEEIQYALSQQSGEPYAIRIIRE
jgi:hypothetical protein